jgi:DNA-binding XRE family transcriptional regulator
MQAAQKITTPQGETLIILPLADYQALLDAADVAGAKAAMGAVARGEIELLTADEAMALVDAPTPLAFWRKKRGLTQAALAAATSISQNYLSGLESGTRKGDPLHFKKLAAALRLRMEDLVAE